MSLVGVDLKGEELEKYGEEVIQVADVIGTDNVKTSTELVDSGREIGEMTKRFQFQTNCSK